jgi:cholesterol transport system auxiliary component
MIKRPGAARLIATGAALAVAAGLAGCITLFPKEKPIQLYRFDAAVQAAQGSGHSFGVRTAPADFDTAAAGDQLMTVDGDQIGYVSTGRWSSPANQMFDEAVAHGFDVAGAGAHLVGPTSKATFRLRLAVSHFEARYTSGPTAPPTVVVIVRATLERQSDLSLVGAQSFEADVPAGDNRVGAIVTAYDAATTKVIGDMVAWVDEKGGS